ncbi:MULTISPECIES: hypothetical protein [Burkholderia]|uniref:Uncharacterized protein n=1 Tax=Burkholderia savannae TaxID=1637837 RepID=A0ABR5T3U1_9BURK|nr:MULTISPECIES: hypothetical protein [Burkholderia]KGS08300.1 hypothetical protein X946_526 [Burkholderia sp. ABCPW 111]KVK82245.1 hypothetical protein WS91_09765 [Burkholderia sp. MSMB1498]KWZ37874.1 hypothetical protein WS72_23405 [Burkholderia savannae]
MKRLKYAAALLTAAAMSPSWSQPPTIAAQSHVSGISKAEPTKIGEQLAARRASLPNLPRPLPTLSASTIRQAGSRASLATRQSTLGAPAAATAATVAPPVAGCTDVTIGAAYNAPTAPAGQSDCFQFVAPSATKIVAYVVNLPANEQHDAHLVQVNEDGSWTVLDSQADLSPNKVVEAIPNGPVRLLLLVSAQQGAGNATFQFQVYGTTGYDSYEPNDSILHPTRLTGNQQINANLDTVADFDYYAVQVPSTQTTNYVTFKGAGTQTAELETAPNTWATLASGTPYNITSPAGATLMFRVYDKGATAPAAQAYTLRVSDGAGTAGFYRFLDNENITHLVRGTENVARVVSAGVIAWDSTGNVRLPPGERVWVRAYDGASQNGPYTLLTETSGYTDANGNLLIDLNVGQCQGLGSMTGDFHTMSVPSDRWRITYNPYAVAVASLDNGQTPKSSSQMHFTHICTELYLGRK